MKTAPPCRCHRLRGPQSCSTAISWRTAIRRRSSTAWKSLGTAGSIRLAGSTLELIGAKPQTRSIDLDANYLAAYRDAIGHFIDCLATGAPFETSPDDNLETLAIVEEAYARN